MFCWAFSFWKILGNPSKFNKEKGFSNTKCGSKLICTCDYRGRTLLYMVIFNFQLTSHHVFLLVHTLSFLKPNFTKRRILS